VVDHGQVIADGTASDLKASLGNTIVEVRLAEAATARKASGRLRRVGPVELMDDGYTVAVKVTDSGRSVMSVVRALDQDGIEPESVFVHEPTLDDVFLQLTGSAAGATPAYSDPELAKGAA
jgi:ABC-type multidrug transport system ATPase subunit